MLRRSCSSLPMARPRRSRRRSEAIAPNGAAGMMRRPQLPALTGLVADNTLLAALFAAEAATRPAARRRDSFDGNDGRRDDGPVDVSGMSATTSTAGAAAPSSPGSGGAARAGIRRVVVGAAAWALRSRRRAHALAPGALQRLLLLQLQ